jgi:hypothetical protein
MAKKVNENNKEAWWIWIVAIIGCLLVWLLGACITRWYAVRYASSIVNNAAALFGDSFGAVNALISALAFAGVFVTFWLQRKELDLQRQELKAQREEFTQQNKTLKLQRFENTFFHMMELQQQIVNDLFIKVSDKEDVWEDSSFSGGRDRKEVIVDNSVRGRQVVDYIYNHYENGHFRRGVYVNLYEKGLEGYENSPYLSLLDHYFRHLYTILRYIDNTDAFELNDNGEEDAEYAFMMKYHYTTIVRATLSRHELLMLYYNGLSKFGKEKLKPLIERYCLLNNLDINSLSFSRENCEVCKIQKRSDIKWDNYGLTGTDYEFYLTKDAHDKSKYLINAFCHTSQEYEEANQTLNVFEKFTANRIMVKNDSQR